MIPEIDSEIDNVKTTPTTASGFTFASSLSQERVIWSPVSRGFQPEQVILRVTGAFPVFLTYMVFAAFAPGSRMFQLTALTVSVQPLSQYTSISMAFIVPWLSIVRETVRPILTIPPEPKWFRPVNKGMSRPRLHLPFFKTDGIAHLLRRLFNWKDSAVLPLSLDWLEYEKIMRMGSAFKLYTELVLFAVIAIFILSRESIK